MRFSSQSLFPTIMLALLAALTFWLEQATRTENGDDGKHRHDPDFIVQNYAAKQLGADGALKHLLTGSKMMHFPDDESTEVTEPRLTYFGGPRPMHLQARTGLITKDGKQITLKDDVRGWREASSNAPEMAITTSTLIAYPDYDIARTDDKVTITQGKSVLTGVGLELDNRLHVLSLLSQVRGSLQPRN